MSPKEAEESMKFWPVSYTRVYRYRRGFVPDEYLVMRKTHTDMIETVENLSTMKLNPIKVENFIKMLTKQEMIFYTDNQWGVDTKRLKTGGCECGAWAIKDHPHDKKCPMSNIPVLPKGGYYDGT